MHNLLFAPITTSITVDYIFAVPASCVNDEFKKQVSAFLETYKAHGIKLEMFRCHPDDIYYVYERPIMMKIHAEGGITLKMAPIVSGVEKIVKEFDSKSQTYLFV